MRKFLVTNNKYLDFEYFVKEIQSKREVGNKNRMVFRLDTMRDYLEVFQNPHENLNFIHIAGTNGKGSTLAYLKKSLSSLGYRVGLYTSPHLLDLCERWQVNYQKISQENFFRLANKIIDIENNFICKENRATVFEFFTVLAIVYFAGQEVDFVLWETGLGGRLDSTNIVTPILSLITGIGLDHQNILGESLEGIAREKAGIIKEGISIITTEKNDSLQKIIGEKANDCKAEYFAINKNFKYVFCENSKKVQFSMGSDTLSVKPALLGEYQQQNLVLCLAALFVLQKENYIQSLPESRDIENTQWSGRLQYLDNGLLVDCAHNVDGVRGLLDFVGRDKKYHFLVSFLEDKAWTKIIDELFPYSESIILFQMPDGERVLDVVQVETYIKSHSPNTTVDIVKQVEDFFDLGYDLSKSIVCGSFILIAEVLALFDK